MVYPQYQGCFGRLRIWRLYKSYATFHVSLISTMLGKFWAILDYIYRAIILP
jgi:hypothetical protein